MVTNCDQLTVGFLLAQRVDKLEMAVRRETFDIAICDYKAHRAGWAVILSEAKDPGFWPEETTEILRFAQDDRSGARMNTSRTYYVYIVASKSRTLYTGVTNNLEKRVFQHKHKLLPGFTQKYNIDRLVYFENWGDIRDAIGREKQIKGWLRTKKVALIIAKNPAWRDLESRLVRERMIVTWSERNGVTVILTLSAAKRKNPGIRRLSF